MSGDTVYARPRRHVAPKMRVHDYLYDSAFIVSGAKDYARTAFRAAMASAQLVIQPVYTTMFSAVRKYPSMRVVYHANCRLPEHMDRSYGGYLRRVAASHAVDAPQLDGRDRFKFVAVPREVLALQSATPDFHPPTPQPPPGCRKPRHRGTQSLFRESSAQTIPWQPDGKQAEGCEKTPEVLYLDNLEWGPGSPYRLGDLPADFHTTEIINKMRHARAWAEVAEKGQFPRWMKRTNAIITDVETKDWIFREAEIDELQDIRLQLLHRLQQEQRHKQTSRTSLKLAKLWASKKQEMERKLDHIRKGRDREMRKLTAIHTGGGSAGQVLRTRMARGGGPAAAAAGDPTSHVHAPQARHGYQARRRHAEIAYDPSLLTFEDHERIAAPPLWLEHCGQDLKRSCSGHRLPPAAAQLCERETKWSEQFLESLHMELKKARLGAAMTTAGPLHILKPRQKATAPRPPTPEVEAVEDVEEGCHQAALLLQKVIRGRAVQNLMYEGRTRAGELTEELKTTHGLQKEDKIRIAREEAKAREYNALRSEAEQKDDAISALVDELCGGAVSAALDFLEKELRRLKEERKQHAFILIAIREKTMREAAESGRRQKEEHRRREHDEMFKQVMGVTQETVDAYLHEVIEQGVELAAEEDAVKKARMAADKTDEALREHGSMSTAEQNDLVAELVQQFLLPEVHKTASRQHIASLQAARLDAARQTIFGLLDDAEIKEPCCVRCGCPLGEWCRCRRCPVGLPPGEAAARDDPRWRVTRSRDVPPAKSAGDRFPPEHDFRCMLDVLVDEGRDVPPAKSAGDRFPPEHDFRCMLDVLVDEAVMKSRANRQEESSTLRELSRRVKERLEATLDAKCFVEELFDRATGHYEDTTHPEYHHYMKRIVGEALDRSVPFNKYTCPKELPSEIRRRADEAAALLDPSCKCVERETKTKVQFEPVEPADENLMLPSQVRLLEEMRRCKCDTSPAPSLDVTEEDDFTTEATTSVTTTLAEDPQAEHEA